MRYDLALALVYGGITIAAPTSDLDLETRGTTFPFTKVIAFGDDFTDNTDGSFAHGITGNSQTGEGKNLWGYGTWTDGPVAVTYLAKSLGMPLKYDYAFGSAGGGAVIGSVCNISAVASTQVNSYARLLNNNTVPDVLSQIQNYTTKGVFNKKMKKTLHFFWTGNNDMIASLGWAGRFTICNKDTLCHPGQQAFIKQLVSCMTTGITELVNAGAKHILVPNVYPRHLSPWTSQYISSDAGMIKDFGGVIDQTNAQLKTAIADINKKYHSKVLYYDLNAFMKKAMASPTVVQGASYNYTCVDGCVRQIPGSTGNWDLWWQQKVLGKQPSPFYWMTTVMPSSTVMQAIANDMKAFLNAHY